MPQKHKVMIVDDSPSIRQLLTVLLEQQGYDVVTAKSGIAALALVEKNAPDVIVLDIAMPDMDGYTMLRVLRSTFSDNKKNIPVICLTAKEKLEDLFHMEGISGYVTKSQESYRELPALIKKALGEQP